MPSALVAGAAALTIAAPAGAHHRERPHRPDDLGVTAVRPYSVTITWTRVASAYAYRLYRDEARVGWQRDSRVFTFWGLRCDESYRLGVRAFDRDGDRSRRRSVRVRTGACPPVNTAPPTISGTPEESETLVAWPGSWDSSEPLTFSYQWGRCAADGGSCSSIFGATDPTYVVAAADTGSYPPRPRERREHQRLPHGDLGRGRARRWRLRCPIPTRTPSRSPILEPNPEGDCTVADTSGCVPGTTLRLTDAKFFCDRPLSSYGTLPLKVDVDFTPGRLFSENGAIDLYTGCAGDGDPTTIDLIVDVEGDGVTYGPGADAFKVRHNAGYNAGIQLTGHVDCGPKYTPSVHQDGVQLQGGRNITFVDFSVGDFANGRSTCQGAGGAFFYSSASGYAPINVDVVRGSYIACNHSLYVGDGSSGDVVGARFRSGRTDGSDPYCNTYQGAPACDGDGSQIDPDVSLAGVTCQRWNASADRWE